MLGSASLAGASVSLTKVSTDPFTNTDSQHRTQVEPDNYSFGTSVVSAFQSGRFFNGGASDTGQVAVTGGSRPLADDPVLSSGSGPLVGPGPSGAATAQ